MKIKIFCRCSLFPSWSGQGLTSTPVNAHIMLNTYTYRQLPATCFGICYAIFRETIALLPQKL